MKQGIGVLLVLYCCLTLSITASDHEGDNRYALLDSEYLGSVIPKSVDVLSSPLDWKTEEWKAVAIITGASAAAYSVDRELNDWLVDTQRDWSRFAGDLGYALGHPYCLIPLTAGAYTLGYLENNPRLARVGLLGLESLLISGGVAKLIKMTVHRHRPRESDSSRRFDGPALSLSEDNQSFPSGHSALAWAVASTVALEYNDKQAVVWTSYALASFVSLSRLLDNAHWLSDVIAGSAIGHAVARKQYKRQQTNDTGYSLSPFLSERAGIAMRWSW